MDDWDDYNSNSNKNGTNATQNNNFAGASHCFVNLFAFTT